MPTEERGPRLSPLNYLTAAGDSLFNRAASGGFYMSNIIETATVANSFKTPVNHAQVIQADIVCDNGIIHVLDGA